MSPVVDGVVFQDNPIVLLTQGQVAPVPYLLGVNNLEFNWLLPFIMKFPMSHLRKETIAKLLWSTSTLLVRGRAVTSALFGRTRQPPYFYLVAALHKGLPAWTEIFLEGAWGFAWDQVAAAGQGSPDFLWDTAGSSYAAKTLG